MADNGYFDMKITNNLVNIANNWIFYSFYFLKYFQYSNQKFQLWNFYSIYLEILEFLFEPRKYILLSTISKEKKRIIKVVDEYSKKKHELIIYIIIITLTIFILEIGYITLQCLVFYIIFLYMKKKK